MQRIIQTSQLSLSLFVIVAGLLVCHSPACGGEFGINLYGLSYHLDRRDVTGYRFNERNPGIGLQFVAYEKQRSRYYLEAAILEDSYRRAAKYVTLGYGYHVYKGFSLGVLFGLYDSRSVAESAVLVAVPMVSFRYRDFDMHLVHLPEFPGINPYPSFALYGTLYVWGGFARKPQQ